MRVAFYSKLAAMQQHYLTAEAEADSATVLLGSIKWLEDTVQLLGRYAATVVADGNERLFVAYAGADLNLSVGITLYCLHCITQQIDY